MVERIAVIGENTIEYINYILQIWRDGNCAVLIDWRIPLQKAIEMMKEASVCSCYIEDRLLSETNNCSSIKFIPYSSQNENTQYLSEEAYKCFTARYDKSEAIIIYSSGTTGKAKGIILSHNAINTNSDAILKYMRLQSNDCIYIAKSLTHSSTLVGELLVGLKTNTKIVVGPTVMPPRYMLKKMFEMGVTVLCLNPTLLSIYSSEWARASYALPALNAIYVSGSVLSIKILNQAKNAFKGIPIYNVYGLSEAGPRVSAQTQICCSENSVGLPISGVEIEIRSPKGEKLPPNQIGIVHIKTNCIFSGYVNQVSTRLIDDWYNTKDLGYVTLSGELWIIGRSDDVIVSGSHKIFPYDVEQVVLSVKEITGCVIFGIPDKKLGERIVCLYTTQNGGFISSLHLVQNCKKKLSGYEIPQEWIHVTELPCNRNGKLSRETAKNNYSSY